VLKLHLRSHHDQVDDSAVGTSRVAGSTQASSAPTRDHQKSGVCRAGARDPPKREAQRPRSASLPSTVESSIEASTAHAGPKVRHASRPRRSLADILDSGKVASPAADSTGTARADKDNKAQAPSATAARERDVAQGVQLCSDSGSGSDRSDDNSNNNTNNNNRSDGADAAVRHATAGGTGSRQAPTASAEHAVAVAVPGSTPRTDAAAVTPAAPAAPSKAQAIGSKAGDLRGQKDSARRDASAVPDKLAQAASEPLQAVSGTQAVAVDASEGAEARGVDASERPNGGKGAGSPPAMRGDEHSAMLAHQRCTVTLDVRAVERRSLFLQLAEPLLQKSASIARANQQSGSALPQSLRRSAAAQWA
jgi:hypothetical protein